jgi:hypothetical protein
VAITDIDVLWLRDPTPFYNRYPDADILTSSDELKTSVGKEEVLEKYPEAGAAFNIGGWICRSLRRHDTYTARQQPTAVGWDGNHGRAGCHLSVVTAAAVCKGAAPCRRTLRSGMPD